MNNYTTRPSLSTKRVEACKTRRYTLATYTLDTYMRISYDRFVMGMIEIPMVVVETATFLARAAYLGMGETERTALIIYLASNPAAGTVVPGSGGVRKLRWALPGRGKSRGARAVYFYHNETIPLYVLDIYAKNEKSNLSPADLKAASTKITAIIAEHERRK